jgi:AmmeMemoRadiSam system protein B
MTDIRVPRLRADIDIIPTSYQGEKVFLVKDSLGLIPQPVLLRGAVLPIIGLIDGMRSIQDIQVELMRLHGGVFVRAEDVQAVISQLDNAFLLDSQKYRQGKKRIIEEYGRGEIREAYLAGRAYPGEREELVSFIQSVLDIDHKLPEEGEGNKISAIIAPHIDIDIGKEVYSKAYRAIKDRSPEKILLLGTGHHLTESYFSLTSKDFATPLGRVKTDKEEVARLKDECSSGIIASHDIDHKNEHSLEFQILFLQHLFGQNFRLMPVLCGSFHEVLHRYARPGEIPGMSGFISGLRRFLNDEENAALIVAGVDFSHIGPKFGHREPATSLIFDAKEHDRILLDAICRCDVASFWSETRKVSDRYNVCGFSTLALLLELLSGRTGYVLGYDFWKEEATQSAVSYAALAFPCA